MLVTTIPIITVRGDALSRGRQLGSQARDQIRHGIDFYLALWKNRSGMNRRYVLDRASEFIPVIERYDPQILEELQGVALGAGASLEEVVALNARYEFVWAVLEEKIKGECTSFGACPNRVAVGHTIVGQTWDYRSAVINNCVITEIVQEGRPNLVIHGEAGVIGQKGLNSAGIGLCVNALISQHDAFLPKVPFWVLARGVLNSTSVAEAIDAVIRAERAVSGNMLIASDAGEMVDLELTPVDVEVIGPRDGSLSHANNFEALAPARNVVDRWYALRPEMKLRGARAKEALEQAGPLLDIEAFKGFFRDHATSVAPICSHPNPSDPEDMRSQTIVSIIMDLRERVIHISEGPPCSHEYQKLTFSSLTC